MENLKKSTLKGTDRDLQLVHCLMLTGKRLQSFKKILGGGFIFFSSLFGEDFRFDEHIFQMGWFNHQPE